MIKIFLFLLLPFYVFTQGAFQAEPINDLIAISSVNSNYNVLDYEEHETLLFDDWQNSTITTKNIGSIKDVLIQYDYQNEDLLVKQEDNVYALDKNLIIKLTMVSDAEKSYYFLARVDPNDTKAFVKVIFSADGVLLCERYRAVNSSGAIKIHGFNKRGASQEYKRELFLLTNGKQIENIRPSRSNKIFEYLNDDSKLKIENLIRDHDLKLKKAEDYTKLFYLYSQADE